MYELISTYGMLALGLIMAALAGVLTRYVFVLIASIAIRELLARLYEEIRAAVLEVGQTYTDAIKEARLDGKLTDTEKAHAKALAIKIAKSNFGMKGLLKLAKVLGIGDDWIGNKVEAFVREAQGPKLIRAIADGNPDANPLEA